MRHVCPECGGPLVCEVCDWEEEEEEDDDGDAEAEEDLRDR